MGGGGEDRGVAVVASAGVSTSLTGILMATWRRYMGQGGGEGTDTGMI